MARRRDASLRNDLYRFTLMTVNVHRRPRWIAAAVVSAVAAALVIAVVWRGTSEREREAVETIGVSPFELLAVSADEEFPQPPSRWSFEFPRDHGAHDTYRTEWWYLSGTLSGVDGDAPALGVQWLLMRIALRAENERSEAQRTASDIDARADAPATSAWRTSQIYAGLFSISTPAGKGLRTEGKLARGAVGLAGATASPVRIWIESWHLAELTEPSADSPALGLHLDAKGLQLDLELKDAKSLITSREVTGQGAAQAAAPFQFYVQPRLRARGTLVADGRRIGVEGILSLEHAWGELPLPGGPVGNDRFSLYLDDGSDLILVRTHRERAGGGRTASTTGLLIDPQGAAMPLADDDVALEPVDHWMSPRNGTRYPIRWSVQIPGRDIAVTLTPIEPDQEGETWLPFWAGPVRIDGTAAGSGFVQLNGYAER